MLDCTSQVFIIMKSIPQMIQALVTRLCSSVNQNADIRVHLPTEAIEQPAMRIDLLGVLLLD